MNETETLSYLFIFNTGNAGSKGSDFSMKVGHANDSLSPAQIGAQITKILDSDAIRVKGNGLTALHKAYLEQVNEYETLF